MNIFFILIFVGVGLYYIIKSVNIPTGNVQANLLTDLTFDGENLKTYKHYVSIYYLIVGILLIVVPFLYDAMGPLIAVIIGIIYIAGAVFLNQKRYTFTALAAKNKPTPKRNKN